MHICVCVCVFTLTVTDSLVLTSLCARLGGRLQVLSYGGEHDSWMTEGGRQAALSLQPLVFSVAS